MRIETVYVDLDGVLAGFDEAMLSLFCVGKETQLTSEERWGLINGYEKLGREWFYDLPVKPGAIELLEDIWSILNPDRVYILSATGNDFWKHRSQKERWCAHVGVDKHVKGHIIVPKAECKQFYANSTSLLIDDNWERCVKPFIDRGGLGIIHQQNELTVQKLRALDANMFRVGDRLPGVSVQPMVAPTGKIFNLRGETDV